MIEKMGDIPPRAGVIVIDAENFAIGIEKPLAKEASEEACGAGDEDALWSKT
jgi:hypothetical protein